MPEPFVIGGLWRLSVGLLLAVIAGGLINLGRGLDWGMAWIVWVPAAVLLLPALHCTRRSRLVADQGCLIIETGWLYRRGFRFGLAGSRIELLPTAGFWVVVLHRPAGAIPLGTWLTKRRALALADWLDVAAGEPLPRSETALPSGDR